MQEKTKDLIFAEYKKNPNVNLNELTEMAIPLENYDVKQVLFEKTKNDIRRLLRHKRDAEGVPTYYSNGKGNIINVETTQSIPELNNVERQLMFKLKGITRAHIKVVNRRQTLFDQLTFFDEEAN